MAEPFLRTKLSSLCIAAVVALILISFWGFADPPRSSSFLYKSTFYDDPETGYTIDEPMKKWDEKRRDWLNQNPNLASKNQVLVVTGSQPSPCKAASGDHMLLRFFKNKVDYCRIHGYQIFYNNGYLEPVMQFYWAKAPILRAAMVAHPEVEWLFWVDSDAVFTDMEFKIPMERYKDHNLVVQGWPKEIFETKSWVSLNAGVFLLRNCQWSMDFLDVWASMGPRSPDHDTWGKIFQSTLKGMRWAIADDQSALVYMLVQGDSKWRDLTYVETQYHLSGYWLVIVDQYDDASDGVPRRHAAAEWERYAAEDGRRRRRPFVTHFTGCAPCSGEPNPAFEEGKCRVGMERALNYADNQVLRSYGFVHPHIGMNGSHVTPLPL